MITVTVVLWVLGLCWKSIAICYKWHLFFLWKRDTLKCVCTQTLRWLVAVSPCLQWQVMLKRHYGRPAARPSHQCCISDYGPVSSQFSVMLVSGVECWRLHCCGSDGCSLPVEVVHVDLEHAHVTIWSVLHFLWSICIVSWKKKCAGVVT